jgi:hypothetical protein
MAHNDAHGAKIQTSRVFQTEERHLKYAGREDYL